MKVLHIISSSGMYGAEAVILNLLRTMRGGPDSAALAVFENASNPNLQLYDAAIREGFEVYKIPCKGQADRSTVAAIRNLADRAKIDVIHSHGYKPDIYVFFALRGSKVALVSTCHTWYDTDRIVTLYGKIDRFVLRSYTRVVAVSAEVKQRLLDAGVRAEKISIVRNGIDLRPFASESAKAGHPLMVGLVGRLAWEKGVDIFLASAAKVLAQLPETRFVVAGEGPDREKLEQQIDALKIRDRATMLGRQDDMPAVYASLDVMVSASRQEGLPMALLEGMASARPLVATTVGEVPQLVTNEQTGLLVAPEDADALAAAILRMLRDAELRKRLGTAARMLIEDEYSADRMTAEYMRVYEAAVAAKRGLQ